MNIDKMILESMERLPPFPAVIHRVLQLIGDPKSSAQDIVDIIQYDQSITANVLMICNSAYFGLRHPVYSVRDALVRIGFNQLMEIVVEGGPTYSPGPIQDTIWRQENFGATPWHAPFCPRSLRIGWVSKRLRWNSQPPCSTISERLS